MLKYGGHAVIVQVKSVGEGAESGGAPEPLWFWPPAQCHSSTLSFHFDLVVRNAVFLHFLRLFAGFQCFLSFGSCDERLGRSVGANFYDYLYFLHSLLNHGLLHLFVPLLKMK